MRGPASGFERSNLIVERLPFCAEDVRACDDHIDFIGASFHRAPNFRDAFLEGGKTRRESSRDRGHMDTAAFDRAPRGFDEGVINADGSDLDVEALDAKFLNEIALNRLSRLGAQSANTLVSVVRSIQVTARRSQAACHSFFTVRRVPMVCARRSTALVFTRTAFTQSKFSDTPRFGWSSRPA